MFLSIETKFFFYFGSTMFETMNKGMSRSLVKRTVLLCFFLTYF